MEALGTVGMIFGILGFVFALSCNSRVDKLEKTLKNLEVLPDTFKSDK